MLPRERVIQVLRRQKPDRTPIYGWLFVNLSPPIIERYGSVAAFEDLYEFDYAHLFGGPSPFAPEVYALAKSRIREGEPLTPAEVLDFSFQDPDVRDGYSPLLEPIAHHKHRRGRFVYVQTPGIFEPFNDLFGIDNHLTYLLTEPDDLRELYARQARWNRAFAMNCLDLGVDMIHVSDDWGAQNSLLFDPRVWREMIFPFHEITTRAVKARGGFLSLHSDGNIESVAEEIAELGYDAVHPWQESAGMDLEWQKRQYGGRFVVMGGLDVQSTLGYGDLARLEAEIERVLGIFRDGGLLFCTSHFVQEHCSMDELDFAYRYAHRRVRELGAGPMEGKIE